MHARPTLPLDLRVVAILHLLFGIGALIEVVVRATQSYIQLNFAVLGIPICFGLLRLSQGWRICALVFAYAKLLLVFFGWLLFLQRSGAVTYGVFGLQLGVVARGWLFTTVAVAVALTLWELHVLTRPLVRRLFVADDAPLRTDSTHRVSS